MSNINYLKRIEAIKDAPTYPNSPAKKKYEHTICGKTYNRPLAFWAEAKSITEGGSFHSSVLYNRLNGKNPWSVSDALGARKGESVIEYRKRTGIKEAKALKIDMKASVINTWLYGAVNVS